MSICSTDLEHPDFAKIRVKWYYQKKDLNLNKIGLSEKEFAQLADDVELFPTNTYDNVYV